MGILPVNRSLSLEKIKKKKLDTPLNKNLSKFIWSDPFSTSKLF